MTERDPLLASTLDSLVPSFEGAPGDWPDALRRGRLPRRSLALGLSAAIAVLVALAVAPAFGLGRGVLPFFGAERAPEPVVVDFASLSTGAPPGMDPEVIASETRKVGVWRFEGKWHTLYVAPTRAGGFCFEWTQAAGGCDKLGTVPVSATWALAPMSLPPGAGPEAFVRERDQGIPIWVTGHVNAEYAAAVEVHFEDGTVVRPEITWVSKPIDAGFFVYDIPADHRITGHRAISVVAVDSHGTQIAEDFLGVGGLSHPLADAVFSKRHAELELETAHGSATLFTAPTRYEGHCVFLEFESKRVPVYPCLPRGYGFDNLAVQVVPTPDDVLLAGALQSRVAEVELQFADGGDVTIHPKGYLLYEIPARHLATGAMLSKIIERDDQGNELTAPPPELASTQPCYRPLPLPSGTHCPGGF